MPTWCEAGDVCFLFSRGMEIFFIRERVIQDLPIAVQVLRSGEPSEVKRALLECLGLFPRGDPRGLTFVQGFKASAQLDERLAATVHQALASAEQDGSLAWQARAEGDAAATAEKIRRLEEAAAAEADPAKKAEALTDLSAAMLAQRQLAEAIRLSRKRPRSAEEVPEVPESLETDMRNGAANLTALEETLKTEADAEKRARLQGQLDAARETLRRNQELAVTYRRTVEEWRRRAASTPKP